MRITKIMYYNDNSRLKINSLCDNVMVLMIKILIETHVFDYRLFFKLNGNQFQNNGKLTDDNRDEIHGIISHIFIQIYIIIYIIRFITILFYLLFYEINHSKEAMNDGWKNIINPQSGTKSFFLEHHDTYGNFHWISIRFIIITMICITTSYLLWILGMIEWLAGSYKLFRIATSVDLFLISLPLILMVYMYFRIPSFYDYFHVRIELRITFIILCIYYIAIVFVQLEIIWLNIFGIFTINSRLFSLIHALITIIYRFSIMLHQK
eukprot:500318_1